MRDEECCEGGTRAQVANESTYVLDHAILAERLERSNVSLSARLFSREYVYIINSHLAKKLICRVPAQITGETQH
jgi:hypothetical protein